MAVVKAIGLPTDSPFKSIDQVPLPEDFAVRAQAGDEENENNDEEEGAESPKSRELPR